MKRYRVEREEPWVVEVECQKVGHPNRDEDGNVQFDNTHYDTKKEAWGGVLRILAAAESLRRMSYEEAKQNYHSRMEEFANAAANRSRAVEAFDMFLRKENEERDDVRLNQGHNGPQGAGTTAPGRSDSSA